MKKNKKYLLISAIALLHFSLFCTLSSTFSFIDIFESFESTCFYIFSMFLCLCLCFIVWVLIFKFVDALKNKSLWARRFLKFAGIFLGVMTFLFLLTFPGVWVNDGFTILTYSRRFILYGWHHVFTQFIYIFGIFFFINPAFIVFFQIIIIALIVGYVLTDASFFLEKKWNIASKHMYLMLIPFLLPPSLIMVLNPLRLSLFAFLQLFVFYEIIVMKLKKQNYTASKLVLLGISIAILSFWRSESIVYFVALPILLLLFSKKQLSRRLVCIFLVSFFAMSVFMFVPQELALKRTTPLDTSMFRAENDITVPDNASDYKTAYQVSGIYASFLNLSKISYKKNDNLLPQIRKYIMIDEIVENEIRTGEALFRGYTNFDVIKNEINSFNSLYVKLIFKHPAEFIAERTIMFLGTNGLTGQFVGLLNAERPTEADMGYGIMEQTFAPSLRTYVLRFLLRLNPTVYKNIFPHIIIFNAVPALVFILVLAILSLKRIRRSKTYLLIALLCFTVLCANFIIVLAAPGRFFMYYYSAYLLGYFIFFALITNRCFQKSSEKEKLAKSQLGIETAPDDLRSL